MRTYTTRAAALTAAVALTLAACGDDSNDDAADAPAAADEAGSEESTDEASSDEASEPGTIVDVAVANGSFTTLVAAVQAAGLVDTLSGEGPFTVFAPTDDAFAAALEALGLTAEELLADTETLTSILTYHVLAGEVDAATAISLDGQTSATVNGAEISISVVDGNVMIDDSTVIIPDVAASNGIIHAIDAVLLPPADDMAEEEATEQTESDMAEEEAMAETGTIVDVAVEAGSFETLVAAVQAAGLVDTLSSEGPFTVFAPTDEAFATALDSLDLTAEELLADTDTLTSILTYHVIPGAVPAADVVTLDGQSVETVNGAEVAISIDGDTVMVNDSIVSAVDVDASNGIIHVIDTVLLP
ncbi:MAG: fasciclin domain-containing protein [Ilumatobacter sp.]|uniref:fasciclin domain-containing protein n=1 Tax=Ilumatobacter sp. TaxID=1967498 RepID=UPI002621AA08|nr:fasciclin domain-containing protein [Ilumatobacter sp.]MDJ0769244.1 fasciclin domain-containing protein [Ilumatobacter sp.]